MEAEERAKHRGMEARANGAGPEVTSAMRRLLVGRLGAAPLPLCPLASLSSQALGVRHSYNVHISLLGLTVRFLAVRSSEASAAAPFACVQLSGGGERSGARPLGPGLMVSRLQELKAASSRALRGPR
uniref:Uncharacterized protein n=1 Tax=Knipowitschia caucasica TaxID=637954 RepID=A0AAV2LM41_KNICA